MEGICRLKGNGCYMKKQATSCICILNIFRVAAYITYPSVRGGAGNIYVKAGAAEHVCEGFVHAAVEV